MNCRVVTPFRAQAQVKAYGSYILPHDVVVSAVYQNLPGPSVGANYAATLAQIAPSLGRNLAGGARTATVPLVAPQTLFEGRTGRLDLRVGKRLRMGSTRRLQLNLDAYNLLNGDSILLGNNTYGAQWRRPNLILDPRIVQLSAGLTF
ncbi:MAG: hypothetical protein HY701_01875 [Gemmatimonadetes bacterium]|nr:hypothetical protein [Gemmatimonadota bacterium]